MKIVNHRLTEKVFWRNSIKGKIKKPAKYHIFTSVALNETIGSSLHRHTNRDQKRYAPITMVIVWESISWGILPWISRTISKSKIVTRKSSDGKKTSNGNLVKYDNGTLIAVDINKVVAKVVSDVNENKYSSTAKGISVKISD